MSAIRVGQVYTTCRGGATSHYPETVRVIAYQPGDRSVQVTDQRTMRHTSSVLASYFHESRLTKAGKRRTTGYYLFEQAEDV